jgi:hypothetical protein
MNTVAPPTFVLAEKATPYIRIEDTKVARSGMGSEWYKCPAGLTLTTSELESMPDLFVQSFTTPRTTDALFYVMRTSTQSSPTYTVCSAFRNENPRCNKMVVIAFVKNGRILVCKGGQVQQLRARSLRGPWIEDRL